MKKKISSFKTVAVCLLAMYMLFANLSLVAIATEGNQELTSAEGASSQETTTEQTSDTGTLAEEKQEVHTADSSLALIEIQNYSIESGTIEAGQNAEILIDLRNVSRKTNANGIMMTISSNSGVLFPAFGTDNQIYVGTISAGGTNTVTIPVTISSGFEGDYVDLTCRFDYESNGAVMFNSATMILPTASGEGLLVQSVGLGSKAIVNANSLLSISYSNMSKENINDAVLNINGNVTDDSREIKLGTAYAGKNYMKDYHINFTAIGEQSVTITLTYTNAANEKITKDLGSYSIEVSEETKNGQEAGTMSLVVIWIGRIIAVIAVVIAAVSVVLYIKKR